MRLASSDAEWQQVRAVLAAYAGHLQPFITADAMLQNLQQYAQQMATWWQGRTHTNKRTSGGARRNLATDSEGTSGITEHSGTSGDQPTPKRAALSNPLRATTPSVSKHLDGLLDDGGSLGWSMPASASLATSPALPATMQQHNAFTGFVPSTVPLVVTTNAATVPYVPPANAAASFMQPAAAVSTPMSSDLQWLHDPSTSAMPSWWNATAVPGTTQPQPNLLNGNKVLVVEQYTQLDIAT